MGKTFAQEQEEKVEKIVGTEEEIAAGVKDYRQYLQDVARRGAGAAQLAPATERFRAGSQALRAAQAAGGVRGSVGGQQQRLARQMAGEKAALDAAMRGRAQQALGQEWKSAAGVATMMPLATEQLAISRRAANRMAGMGFPQGGGLFDMVGGMFGMSGDKLKRGGMAIATGGLSEVGRKFF